MASELQIPGKYDVIPIHNSDRVAFKKCKERWNWSSPSRQNLTVRADIHGISLPLLYGTGIHYALEQSYSPIFKRSAVEAWKTWFDIQWNGGIVTEDWLDLVYDLEPQSYGDQTEKVIGKRQQGIKEDGSVTELYKVRGLQDILPDPDQYEFDEILELGVKMLTFYEDYAKRNDGFEVFEVEHSFSVPIWDFENDEILKAQDLREESPNYGNMLEVHSRGRIDAYTLKPDGKLGIIDHKTAERMGEDYFIKLETDEQCTTYLYAAEVEATYYDLPHKGQPFEEVLYNVLRKSYPKPPTEIRGGMFSVDREKESCTYEMLCDWIATHIPGVPLSERQLAYIEYLKNVGDEQFIVRKSVTRNRHQLKNAGYRLYLEALDMIDPSLRIYPNLTNDFGCLNCSFRAPCLAKQDGGDWEQMIQDNYSVNRDR